MQLSLPVRLGDTEIQVTLTATTHAEVFEAVSFWQRLPKECNNCKSGKLRFDFRQPQGFTYYSVVCEDCGERLQFGQLRDNPDHLFPKEWEPPFDGGQKSNSNSSRGSTNRRPPARQEDEVEYDEGEEAPPFEEEERAARPTTRRETARPARTEAEPAAARRSNSDVNSKLAKYRRR